MPLTITQTCDRCDTSRNIEETHRASSAGWRSVTTIDNTHVLCPICIRDLDEWVKRGQHWEGPVLRAGSYLLVDPGTEDMWVEPVYASIDRIEYKDLNNIALHGRTVHPPQEQA